MRSGIGMSEWERAGPRAIRTAFDLYREWAQPDDEHSGYSG